MEIYTYCSHSVNYLIYLQNIFLNSHSSNNNSYYFPYWDNDETGFKSEDEFIARWKDSFRKIINGRYHANSEPLLVDKYSPIFLSLFEEGDKGIVHFEKNYKSFLSWWNTDGFGAQLLIELFTNELPLYDELQRLITKDKPKIVNEKLTVEIIYDDAYLLPNIEKKGYVLIPYKELINYKLTSQFSPELTNKVMNCLY